MLMHQRESPNVHAFDAGSLQAGVQERNIPSVAHGVYAVGMLEAIMGVLRPQVGQLLDHTKA
jgi:hypothetical protein